MISCFIFLLTYDIISASEVKKVENKAAFLSGRLNGTKTLEGELEAIKSPDEIEMFLKALIQAKFTVDFDNEVIYVNDDEEFTEKQSEIEAYDAVSIYVNESFSRLYITANKKTYAVRINKINSELINDFISKEKPVKYALNAFAFVKWCNANSIDLRNVYDIPTYIKLLTNNVDPFLTHADYMKKYADFDLMEDDNEHNAIAICNFILKFGEYLSEFVEKFNLSNVSRLINENSYFEASSFAEEGMCKVSFSYINLDENIKEMIAKKVNEFSEKAYIISPLGRIALKFGSRPEKIMEEVYNSDIELMVLNELYNNNIKVVLMEENLYEVKCKFKSVGSVVNIVTAIMNDIFYTMFERNVDIKLDCIVRQ